MRTLRFYSKLLYFLSKYGRKSNLKKQKFTDGTKEACDYIDNIAGGVMKELIKISGAEVKIKGLENIDENENYLFVSNHQGNFDIILLFGLSPRKMAFLAKKEMEELPFLSNIMRARGCVFLDRDDPRKGVTAINKGIEFLKNGGSMSVFPEGKRSKGMEMGTFKPGALRLATKSKVKVAPVVIKGSYKLMEKNGGRIKPAKVEIEFLKPVDSREYKDATKLSTNLEKMIRDKLQINN